MDGEAIVLIILGAIIISILFVGAYDKQAPLVNVEYIEGEITSITDIKRDVVYIVSNESFTCWGLPIDDVNLNAPCKIYYGFTPLFGYKAFERIEYLEVK